MDRDRHAGRRRGCGASAAMWSWCECTPPGESSPMQMAGAAAGLQLGDRNSASAGLRASAAVGDRGVDARQVLHDHAAGADIHMADLGIAHLAVRAARHDVPRRRSARAGPSRRSRPRPASWRRADRVVVARGALAPAVEDAEHDRTRRRGAGGGHGGNIGIGRGPGNRPEGRGPCRRGPKSGPAARAARCYHRRVPGNWNGGRWTGRST